MTNVRHVVSLTVEKVSEVSCLNKWNAALFAGCRKRVQEPRAPGLEFCAAGKTNHRAIPAFPMTKPARICRKTNSIVVGLQSRAFPSQKRCHFTAKQQVRNFMLRYALQRSLLSQGGGVSRKAPVAIATRNRHSAPMLASRKML